MKNFKKLSRDEMKNALGGRACTLTIKNSNGTYTTLSGKCDTTYTSVYNPIDNIFYAIPSSFCNTGDGVAHTLTSNGGVSRC